MYFVTLQCISKEVGDKLGNRRPSTACGVERLRMELTLTLRCLQRLQPLVDLVWANLGMTRSAVFPHVGLLDDVLVGPSRQRLMAR